LPDAALSSGDSCFFRLSFAIEQCSLTVVNYVQ
jgi:hypothetical protein